MRGEIGNRQRYDPFFSGFNPDQACRADALLVGDADQFEGAAVERMGRIDDFDGAYGELRNGKATAERGIVL